LICTTGQVAAQTKVTYFHNDLSGNPVAASDSTGQIIWRESYRPYGERLKNEAASQTNSQWYTGHRQDADTGLVYMGARHYDPLMGRFLSIDPVGFRESNPHSFNRYAYANNNPMKFIDPDGRAVHAIVIGGGILLIGGTVIAANTTSEQRQEIADGFRALSRQFSNLLNATADNGNTSSSNGNKNSGGETQTNPYKGPVSEPVVVVDPNGNAIPVEKGQQVKTSPNGDYQQVLGSDGKPNGVRLDRGGHKGQKDPSAQDPHAHRPGVTTPDGNPHLPIKQ
jgi:RHS repeat-associated protein